MSEWEKAKLNRETEHKLNGVLTSLWLLRTNKSKIEDKTLRNTQITQIIVAFNVEISLAGETVSKPSLHQHQIRMVMIRTGLTPDVDECRL